MLRKQISINDMTDADFERAYDMIPTERRRRLGRIRNENDHKRSIAADMLVRACVSELAGVDPAAVTFSRTESGKPFSTSSPEVEFNLSHSGEYAVCVADSLPIGVDIEQLRTVRMRIARRFCTPAEMQYVFGEPRVLHEEEVPNARFEEVFRRLLTIWTLKEAYFKNIGKGIAAALKSVEFTVDENNAVRCSVPGYRFTLDYSIFGYVLAICETER